MKHEPSQLERGLSLLATGISRSEDFDTPIQAIFQHFFNRAMEDIAE